MNSLDQWGLRQSLPASASLMAAGLSVVGATVIVLPCEPDSSIAYITSSTCEASCPLARCGVPCWMLLAMSDTPTQR